MTRSLQCACLPDRSATAIRVPDLDRPIEVKIASARDEFEQAFQLLAARYEARGYEVPSTKLFRFTSYHVLPETTTFVAKERDRVVATLSLVPDTRLLGLPMEAIYGEEIAALRRAGHRLREVTSLADQDLSPREFLPVFMALIRLMVHSHARHGCDTWVLTVNPRHSRFYRKALGAEPLGPRRSYPSVQAHPAEAFRIDRELFRSNAPGRYQEFFDDPLPEAVLDVPARPLTHAWYFGDRSTRIDAQSLEDLILMVEHSLGRPRWDGEDPKDARRSPDGPPETHASPPDDPEGDIPWVESDLEEAPDRRHSIRFPLSHDRTLLQWEQDGGDHARTARPVDLSRAAILLEVQDPPRMGRLVRLGLVGADGTDWIESRVIRHPGPGKVTLAFVEPCSDHFFRKAVFGA
jgi:hypothetical protein